MNKYFVAAGVVAVGSCAASSVAGYFFAKGRLTKQFEDLLAKEILATKKFYAIVNKDGVTPEQLNLPKPEQEVPEEIKLVLDRYAGRTEKIQYHRPVEKPEVITQNIFANVQDDPKPELITEAEYLENGPEYTQVSYTYYQGDGTVADQSDEVVEDVPKNLGLENFEHFGEGDWDPNILYIMNRRLEHMYEINLSSGKYSVEVMGLDE